MSQQGSHMMLSLLLCLCLLPAWAACLSLAPADEVRSNPDAHGFKQFDATTRSHQAGLSPRAGNLTECQYACSMLSIALPDNVTQVGQAGYEPLPYWSVQQSELVPACRVDVTSAEAISSVIKISKLTQCPFTVKSGGHAAFAGGSSIENGILINLAPLNMVELSADRKTASVGPGNTWYDVYVKLDALNVSIVGGREAGVGTGGLTLGGGISYFSGRYGWACDNVRNYEVVLADGSIVNASVDSYPDLYWALRGGSGTNFGIVSRFDYASFDQGLLWGGGRYYDISTNISLANAFANFNEAAPTDDYAHLYIAFVYTAALGGYVGVSGPVYGKPIPNPPIFDELSAIPSIVDATSVASLSTLALELNQTAYLREIFKTVTFKNNATLIAKVIEFFVEESSSIINVTGLAPAFAFQPISLNIIEQMAKNGGNALGLTSEDGPLMIMNLNWGWALASDDTVVINTVNRFIDRSVALAKSMGLDNRFIYMNYATLDEDVYAGYGEENEKRLEEIKQKYDPTDVFGRLWPGYFKLGS